MQIRHISAVHKGITYVSDGILVTAIGSWAFLPQIKDLLGVMGGLGALFLLALRIWQSYLDVQSAKLRLERARNTVDPDTEVE